MATIKAIDVRSIHQIQSGQVIVDLCSVVKELVENSLDASATSIEELMGLMWVDIRLKDYGLQAVEVQDNGDGISPDSFKNVALKHHTSKLSTYSDLNSLQTFGFRGEALSSLCALSNVHIITARSDEAPKGTRLEFEISGKLKGKSVTASQKGTTVVVERLFGNLPVRRRELEKNAKREYNKVLGILNAYACISTGVKFSVSNHMVKGKKTVAFATKSNLTTRENIANVFGAKTLTALVPLDLKFELQPSPSTQKWSNVPEEGSKEVRIVGHISRPIVGEGRQMPDRQMFFVNSRPCGQPQVAKAFNEVYKSYNVSQSPFIFADLRLDENSYDVNVSPDKRTILLHDQNALLESLKASLIELFESTDQTVPHSHILSQKLPAFKQLSINHPSPTLEESINEVSTGTSEDERGDHNRANSPAISRESETTEPSGVDLVSSNATLRGNGRVVNSIGESVDRGVQGNGWSAVNMVSKEKLNQNTDALRDIQTTNIGSNMEEQESHGNQWGPSEDNNRFMEAPPAVMPVIDFNRRISEQQEGIRRPPLSAGQENEQDQIPSAILSTPRPPAGVIRSAFDRMRPKRVPADTATITIGSTTITSPIGTPVAKRQRIGDSGPDGSNPVGVMRVVRRDPKSIRVSKGLRSFAAPGTQLEQGESETDEARSLAGGESSGIEELPFDTDELMDTNKDDPYVEGDDLLPSVDNDPAQAEDEHSIALDIDCVDEAAKKDREEEKVRRMIQEAEKDAAHSTQDSIRRASNLCRTGRPKDSTTQLVRAVGTSVARIKQQVIALNTALERFRENTPWSGEGGTNSAFDQASDEDRLSLTVSKEDFAQMRIIGQFNLGFIIACRPAQPSTSVSPHSPSGMERGDDDLFIIDQHASDEKYNFERLQAETIVQNQRLVQPRILELPAVEEEIVIEHQPILVKNGFLIEVDENMPVGRRCRLVSLPMSRGVVFDHRDLEELIALLADSPTATILRPSKVRRMFASRACRSSIMIGRTLTLKQMQTVVKHMGELEKPWNCPHGRPTMRHLMGTGAWEGWEEGDGLVGMRGRKNGRVDWGAYVGGRSEKGEEGKVWPETRRP
ncbi:hypothetical protein FGG08_005319 [Glutinoglossum americanum]|uniref:DNA mismatch repair protein PMS1 n=1 Tax=Glutinoglossum americanum TaxID=1670608 RepID=A0A9P8I381_9PEZI|nr:hypothetical protein FGG08_005319 [Glutinoglossum americanum]